MRKKITLRGKTRIIKKLEGRYKKGKAGRKLGMYPGLRPGDVDKIKEATKRIIDVAGKDKVISIFLWGSAARHTKGDKSGERRKKFREGINLFPSSF